VRDGRADSMYVLCISRGEKNSATSTWGDCGIPMDMTSLHASLEQQRVCSALPLTNAGHSMRHRLTMWYTAPASWRNASIIHAVCYTLTYTQWTAWLQNRE